MAEVATEEDGAGSKRGKQRQRSRSRRMWYVLLLGSTAWGKRGLQQLHLRVRRVPFAGAPWAVAPCGLAAGDSPLRASRSRSCPRATTAPAGGLHLRVAAPTGGRPLQEAWPQPVAPLQGALAAAGRPVVGGRSYILVFQIRMEKMKEVKRPPL
ncbi:hypothetical protein GW17_00015568 [Ensete ventricosum]|nr:hypothetical protein GW17_00015568 [Ensete ventricosum]RZR96344.1 hypothetical protein BHM03_00025343 [Ensete ventricosum]